MIDTHCHLHSSEFDTVRKDLILKLQEQNMGVILVGTSIEDSKNAINLSQKYEFMYSSIGIHPHEYENINLETSILEIENIINTNQVVALGECGFDFYYHLSDDVKSKQESLFRVHLDMAIKYRKPVIIHTRDSFEDTYRVLSEYEGLTIILHCFTGDKTWVDKFSTLNHKIYFSFSGIITFKNTDHIQDAVRATAMDRLLVETDSPYLSPVPHRGKQNTPLFLSYNIDKIADLLGLDYFYTVKILDQNAKHAFCI
ncbi:MAG: hypothetical protein RLZZ223_330 [Candidatus Parcubacteria bacterium]|jgi:TatD DNase family protein